jgi:hypothetical protein
MSVPAPEEALTSPSVARNREPILAVLKRILPERGQILEIASGTGEHAVFFAAGLPNLVWHPTDQDPLALRSITAYRAAAGLANLAPPLPLDASASDWPVSHADAVVAINMVHISPWRATEGLMRGSERILPSGGILYLYGAYKENGIHTAPSNAVFDESLRARHPDWGVRDVVDVVRLADTHGLVLVEQIPMPAHNLSLVFRRLA